VTSEKLAIRQIARPASLPPPNRGPSSAAHFTFNLPAKGAFLPLYNGISGHIHPNFESTGSATMTNPGG
jgi:hypothetical protein